MLLARTFLILAGMILISAITSKFNKTYETTLEMVLTFIGTLGVLIFVFIFSDSFPLNILFVSLFATLMGWQIGPTIERISRQRALRKFATKKGIPTDRRYVPTEEEEEEFERFFTSDETKEDWSSVVSRTFFASAAALLATAGIVFISPIDFSFLGLFLFVALIALIIVGVISLFVRSKALNTFRVYFGVLIFTGYLLYDFNQLEKLAQDESWAAAVNIAVNIYIDLINLFILLLQIFADSD